MWGTYGILRAFSYRTGPDSLRLFRYSPDTDEMTFFDHGLPRTDDPADKSKPDTSILGPDGMIYIGTDAGSLIRLNPATAQAELLCCPSPESRRLPRWLFILKIGCFMVSAVNTIRLSFSLIIPKKESWCFLKTWYASRMACGRIEFIT